jgi:hypothetical protein
VANSKADESVVREDEPGGRAGEVAFVVKPLQDHLAGGGGPGHVFARSLTVRGGASTEQQ